MEGEGLFVPIGMGRPGAWLGAAEGALEGILRGFEWFLLCL